MQVLVGPALGKGAHGSVHLGRVDVDNHAIKFFHRTHASMRSFWREQRAHARLQNPGRHIMRPFALHRTPGETHHAVAMMPLAEGDAYSHFIQNTSSTDRASSTWLEEIATFTAHVVDALRHMHRMGVAHRDIKLENVVAVTSDEGTLQWKVSDFGASSVAVHWGADAEMVSTSLNGTMRYVPPEFFEGTPGAERRAHGIMLRPGDMWALGVTLWHIVTRGRKPWEKASVEDPAFCRFIAMAASTAEMSAWKAVVRDVPDSRWLGGVGVPKCLAKRNITPALWDFIQQCLRLTPEVRMTAEEAWYHPWCILGRQCEQPGGTVVTAPPVLQSTQPAAAAEAGGVSPAAGDTPDRIRLPPAIGTGRVTAQAQGAAEAPVGGMANTRSKSLGATL